MDWRWHAPLARNNGMPENWGYMWAAYAVTAVVLVAYAVSLIVRVRREKE